jgi:hypothetical protein
MGYKTRVGYLNPLIVRRSNVIPTISSATSKVIRCETSWRQEGTSQDERPDLWQGTMSVKASITAEILIPWWSSLVATLVERERLEGSAYLCADIHTKIEMSCSVQVNKGLWSNGKTHGDDNISWKYSSAYFWSISGTTVWVFSVRREFDPRLLQKLSFTLLFMYNWSQRMK